MSRGLKKKRLRKYFSWKTAVTESLALLAVTVFGSKQTGESITMLCCLSANTVSQEKEGAWFAVRCWRVVCSACAWMSGHLVCPSGLHSSMWLSVTVGSDAK